MFYSKSSSFAVFCKKWFSYPVSSIFVFLICRRTVFPKPPPIQEIEMSITPFAEYLHSNLTERLSLQHAIHVNFTKVAIILCLANNFDDFLIAM